jgi:putative NADH-flavin reductase
MKIAVLGGTGGTGSHIVKMGLDLGYDVKVLARTPSKMTIRNEHIEIIQGDALNLVDVEKTIESVDVVFYTLGAAKAGATTIYSETMKNVVEAMKIKKVSRILIISASGVKSDDDKNIGFVTKRIIIPLFLKKTYVDMEKMEDLVMESDLNFTLMSPQMLTTGPLTKSYKTEIGLSVKNGRKISRADLAHYMINNIANDEISRKKVGIAY